MRTYGVIYAGFWSDPEFGALNDGGCTARELAAYLLTSRHTNGLGCFYLPADYVSADLRCSRETVLEGFAKLSANGFVSVCERTRFVLIHKFLKWNEIINPNMAKMRLKEFDAVPQAFEFREELIDEMERFGKHWPNGLETIREGSRNRERERERERSSKAGARTAKPHPVDNSASPENTPPSGTAPPPEQPKAPATSTRGTRFKKHQDGIPPEWAQTAKELRPDLDAVKVYDSFSDHWAGKAGSYGVKLDWLATWRNWLRKEPAGRPGTAAAAPARGNGPAVPDQWWKTDEGIKAKAIELEVTPPKVSAPGEWLIFRARVIVAAGDGPWVPDDKEITLHKAVEWVRKQQSV